MARRSPALLALLALAVLAHLSLASAYSAFPYTRFSTCSGNSRYDISSVDCQTCPVGSTTSYNDFTKCLCPIGTTTSSTSAVTFTCSACPASSNREGTACMTCGTGSTLSGTQCSCTNPAQVLVERDAAGALLTGGKQCLPCPSHGRVLPINNDPYTCSLCENTAMTMDALGACTCTDPLFTTVLNRFCLKTTTYSTLVGLFGIKYRDVRGTDNDSPGSVTIPSGQSYYLKNFFAASAVRCIDDKDRASCQMLANLCVLQKYDKSSDACAQFLAISNAPGFLTTTTNGFGSGTTNLGWKTAMPFLYWPENSVLKSEAIQTKVVLTNPDPGTSRETIGTLAYYLAKYTINGTFLGFETLTNQLQLCSGDFKQLTRFLRFGVNYYKSCQYDLTQLLGKETYFYDLYYQDIGSSIFPVPIKIINYRAPDQSQPNGISLDDEIHSDSTNIYTGRFFIYDTISARSQLSNNPAVLVYPKSMKLRIEMRDSSQNMIYPPQLVIEYGERRLIDINSGISGSESEIIFQTEYSSDFSSVSLAGIILFSFSIVFGLLSMIRRFCLWERKNHGDRIEMNFSFILRLIIYIYNGFTNLFFIFLTAITFYIFLFYKGQKTIYLLLPEGNSSETRLLGQFLVVLMVGKLMEILYQIVQQSNADIFLIDWEKPKGEILQMNGFPTGPGDEENNGGGVVGGGSGHSVSVWRKIFVANEWSELQSERLINVPLTLFFMIFLMRALNLEYLATAQPTFSTDPEAAPLHPILVYAVTTFFLLIIIGLQLFYYKYIHTRFFYDSASQFLNFLSNSNISLLIFTERYHAYYLHGKSVFPSCDLSMEEFNLLLLAEEKTWMKQRGLLPGKDCWEIYFTGDFRAIYDREYMNLVNRALLQAGNRQAGVANRRGGGTAVMEKGGRANADAHLNSSMENQRLLTTRLVKANQTLNLFLCRFLEKALPAFPFDFSENTYWRKLFQLPPFIAPNAPCVFFEDSTMAFQKTLLRGIEVDMALFLILLYGLVTYAFGNELVAVFVCFLVDRALVGLRSHYGKLNIARKTLLDERFMA